MKQFSYDEVKIVGFDGAVVAPCARALAVAHHAATDRYFQLSHGVSNAEARTLYTSAEIALLGKEGRLTLLPMAVSAFPSAMVIYVTKSFLDAASCQLPDHVRKEVFRWQSIFKDTWASCGSSESIEYLMNQWGQQLMSESTELLMRFCSTKDERLRDNAEHLSVQALFAARERKLRASIYLRYGLALLYSPTPERLENMYSLIFSREFSLFTPETFQARLFDFANTLQMKTTIEVPSGAKVEIQAFSNSSQQITSSTPSPHKSVEQLNKSLHWNQDTHTEGSLDTEKGVSNIKYDVFLSYSSVDQQEATELFEAVTSAGARAFLSKKSITPGVDFAEEIRRAILESSELWLLVSPSSLKSDWVISEWGAAWVLGKRIIPILHRCRPEDLPDRIRRLHCIDFYNYPELVQSLLTSIR